MSTSALLFVTGAILLASLWRIIARAKTKPAANDIAFTSLVDGFAAASSLVILALTGFDRTVASDPTIWLLFGISILFATLGDYLLLVSTKYADLADTSILLPLSNFWTLLIAAIFLGETVSVQKMIAVALIIVGSMLTIMTTGKIVINRGILAITLYGICAALMNSIDKGISNAFAIPLYAAISYGASAIALFLLLGTKRVARIQEEWKLQGWWLSTIGVLWALFSFMLLSAYRHGDVSSVVPFTRLFIVVTTFYSLIVLKERARFVQKLIGSIIVTSGAILLAFSG
ncbi:DMT family transporter [Patescibacteria group bacterium]|nr:DMT family transporter [Patescibacteria group bacterium]